MIRKAEIRQRHAHTPATQLYKTGLMSDDTQIVFATNTSIVPNSFDGLMFSFFLPGFIREEQRSRLLRQANESKPMKTRSSSSAPSGSAYCRIVPFPAICGQQSLSDHITG